MAGLDVRDYSSLAALRADPTIDFIVAYTVNNILTVQWDDQWRGDVIATGLGSAQMDGSDGIATASGWVTQKFGGFPKSGDTLAVGACELRVEEMDGPRVARLKLTRRG